MPTPTPLPLPVITQFDVAPLVITVGQTINLAWDVSNVDKVTIQGITGATEYPPKGNISQQPDKAGTIQYVLSAKNGQPGGDVNMIREVTVNPAPPPPVAPTIEYFTAAPAQVVNGFATNIKLSWSVTGDTTNIQIMGPDIGTITGLAAQDSLTVSSDKATLFNLTAFNGDLSANQIAQITGVDPTPTPPPTATPVPPPVIYYFKLLCNDGSDCSDVTRDDSTLVPLHTRYIVLGGSKVRFEWQLHGAVRVTFGSSTIPAVDVPAVNDTPSFVGDRLITTGDTYELKAYAGPDATSATASMFIDIVIQQPPAPPPPFNVDGTYAATAPITVTWSYNQSDIDNYKVVGFRVYRADVPSSNFVRVADYTDIPANKREWADPLSSPPSPTCGKAYYVVAVNLDTEGNPQESTPSTTSWYTPVCP